MPELDAYTPYQSSFPGLGYAGSGLSGFAGMYNGLTRGGFQGDLSAALSGGNLYNNWYGNSNDAQIPGLSYGGDVLGIYTGLRQGGVMGDAQAGVDTLQLANQSGLLGEAGGAMAGVGDYIPFLGAGLGVYNFLNNWQSGNTGSDALNGASAGAGIGTAIEPGIGTVVGAVIGGAAGALSSAFGPGEADPEMTSWQNYVSGYNQFGSQMNSQNVSPQQAFTSLAGIFDSRTANDNPLYNQFGRMGEGAMMQGMATQINNAYAKGTINSKSTPTQIYNSVVAPWIATMPGGQQWNSTYNQGSVGGNGVVQNLLTTLIGQYTSGAFNSNTPVTISGLSFAQNGATLAPFAGLSSASGGSAASSSPVPTRKASGPAASSPSSFAPLATVQATRTSRSTH